MGQQKGNPTPSVENQAYETLRPNTNARANRDMGTKPVMINDTTTLNEVVDLTFNTDSIAAMVSGSINTTILTISGSTNTTILAISGSTNTTIGAVSSSLSSRLTITGSCVNDAAAAAVGVAIGGLYHTTGTVKVRLT
jgi:hypothetical protein